MIFFLTQSRTYVGTFFFNFMKAFMLFVFSNMQIFDVIQRIKLLLPSTYWIKVGAYSICKWSTKLSTYFLNMKYETVNDIVSQISI